MKVVRGLLTLGFLAAVLAWPVRGSEPAPEAGIASHYGPGTGVATQWCTWTLRHSASCGWVQIQSHDTGIVVLAPVVDWCQCYRGTANERIVDLQWGVLAALGLDPALGLYDVSLWRIDAPAETVGPPSQPAVPSGSARSRHRASEPALPDTAVGGHR